MDVVASNLANAQTTRGTLHNDGTYDPYRRKMVHLETEGRGFGSYLQQAKNTSTGGVRVTQITEDRQPFRTVFDPGHPDANENGFVQYPNVDPLKEMVDLMSVTRSYEANITALNASKDMLLKALEIGR
jgi:flagellar basal-body rod protein FlgC